uniref:SFRICE_011436 n=1 Tax=Spodoptera frugiperda TaxID=7108 RepID=A0A2H1VDY4_SPOFR
MRLVTFLNAAHSLVKTRGKLKAKKLATMVQTAQLARWLDNWLPYRCTAASYTGTNPARSDTAIDKKMLGVYGEGLHSFAGRREVALEHTRLDALEDGPNEARVILGKVVGSIHNDNAVPFTFALVDESMECVLVTVYNWADGRGAIIGDCVTIPEPLMRTHKYEADDVSFDFKSIRINNPLLLLVNGKRVARNQFACTRVTSTYEIH